MTNDTRQGSTFGQALAHQSNRRDLLKRAAAAGIGTPLIGSLLATCDVERSEGAQGEALNQSKRARDGLGLRGHNSGKAWRGFTLFSPLFAIRPI